jgi:hypothetical protein
MKKREVVDRETPEARFTGLMKDYTTLKKQRLILLGGHLDAVCGSHWDYQPPLGEATIWLPYDGDYVEFVIEGETPPDLEQKIQRSARRLQGLLLQVNTYWLKQAITQLYALGAEGNLNLNPLTEFTTYKKEVQAERFEAQLRKRMIKPRGET